MEEPNCLFSNPNHFASLNTMRLSGKMCDVTIKVNDKEFQAHKTILAASLKYFESMFLNPFQESKQDVIYMQDVEANDLETLISFAYTGKILLTASNALGLLEIANYLNEDVIKEACINFLVNNLKEQDACRAYKFANATECISLKNVSRFTILLHFEYCSQTAEYLDFDCESLKDVLSSANLNSQEMQKCLFKGVMRWIMHNGSKQTYINDLLDTMKISKLNSDFLLDYLCTYVKNQDYDSTIKNIMTFYHEKRRDIHRAECLKKSLMVIGAFDNKLHAQFFDFAEKKWCKLGYIANSNNHSIGQSVMLREKFYCTNLNGPEKKLNVFNPTTKENTTLSSDSRLLSGAALHACADFLYLCGGIITAFEGSNQVLRYDLRRNLFKIVAPLGKGRSNATAIFYRGCLHILGGRSGVLCINSVEKYDPDTKKWTDLPAMCESREHHAAAILDGKLYVCGGFFKKSAEVYEPSKNSWQLIASMNKLRCKFLVVAHEGKLLAIGGDHDFENTVEVYDSRNNKWQISEEYSLGLKIKNPHGGILSSSYAN